VIILVKQHSDRVIHKVLEKIKKSHVKWIRLQFCNPFGLLHQLSVPSQEITEESFVKGFPLDGSSILGCTPINESDVLLIPDPDTFIIVPDYFDRHHYNEHSKNQYVSKSARMLVDLQVGFSNKRFSRDSRYIAQKAEKFLQKKGFSTSRWSSEIEFFIFDKLTSSKLSKKNKTVPSSIESIEAPWGTQNLENAISLKRGYYISSPSDTLVDFRDEVADTLKEFGINVIAHHHEVATAGQSEIVLSPNSLLQMADTTITVIKTIKEVAGKRGRIASFNPKPIPNDNGSALHINQSLWLTKNGKKVNAFYDPNEKYAELSQTAYYYIGGLLEHAEALCAVTNPTLDSYRRLVPGYEAPTNIAWGRMNRSVSVRIPAHHRKTPSTKRIEYRPPDPTSNIYLDETAILLAGLDGIQKKTQPPEPVDKDTYKFSDSEKRKHSIRSLPTSLSDALDAFNSDNEFLRSIFDDNFLEAYYETIKKQTN
jgi:glutamine synthetase|tara:strand:- start:341 stop:1783 length:1443 start_codon:yes stop_codon:yes gene_type:complete